jgi:hypothetical protein
LKFSSASHSETAHAFADGNVTATLEKFPTQHECNDFCKFFGLSVLQPDSVISVDADESSHSKTPSGSNPKPSYNALPSVEL